MILTNQEVISAMNRHQVRISWADGGCLAYAYPKSYTTPVKGSGASVSAAVGELLDNLRSFEVRRGRIDCLADNISCVDDAIAAIGVEYYC